MKQTAILLLLFINSIFSFAPVISQDLPQPTEYPKGYFRNPLNIPIQLAANFGELRTNHFHMGLDIRTNQRENLPVYAAADGYISRIKIERFGFGRAIYITHPNGYTTLYAHLNAFYPELNKYLIDKQYADEQWEQEFELQPEQFPVTKGQFIAYSGNTGGSQGPHLHFEIRDTKTGNNLNPWLFDFGLRDNIKPYIYRLYYYDRRYSTYRTSPAAIPIRGANGNYATVNNIVTVTSPYISFGISAEDKNSASSFRYGIFGAQLYIDDSLVSGFKLNDISYNDTRYINGSIDYKTRASGGSYIQHLSRLPGNRSTIFDSAGNGEITLTDTSIHTADIVVTDAEGNISTLKYRFRWDPTKTAELMFAANSIGMAPNKENTLREDDIEVDFSSKAFYDTVPFVHRSETSNDSKTISAVHYLDSYKVPVHDSFTVRIKPLVLMTDTLKDKVVMQMISNRKVEAVKGSWAGDFLQARFRDLGIFKLILDTIPPRISLAEWSNGGNVSNRRSLTLVSTDNVGEVKSFKAFLDGSWIMFSRKDDSFIHTFDERTPPGRHELRVLVEDMAGNITERMYSFTR